MSVAQVSIMEKGKKDSPENICKLIETGLKTLAKRRSKSILESVS